MKNILEIFHLPFAEKIVYLFPLDHFTVTEDFSSILEEFSEAFSQPFWFVGSRKGFEMGTAGDFDSHLAANEIHRSFGHQAVGNKLAAGDRDQIMQAIFLSVVNQREPAADGAVISFSLGLD